MLPPTAPSGSARLAPGRDEALFPRAPSKPVNDTTAQARNWIRAALKVRLAEDSARWLDGACRDIAAGVEAGRFASLIALASRKVAKRGLAPTEAELRAARDVLAGWNPERWTLLESARVALVLARGDLARDTGVAALEEVFRYADVGELCALYRSLALLPDARRLAWRAGEGARSNMRAVFEASCCDTPFPFLHFDDVAWRQAAIKCIFVGAPLWRIFGLDRRLSPELARMALDLADERRAAGRRVYHELWLCLGPYGGARGLTSVERELASDFPLGRRAAGLALARLGELERLRSLAVVEDDPEVRDTMNTALAGQSEQTAFKDLDLSLTT